MGGRRPVLLLLHHDLITLKLLLLLLWRGLPVDEVRRGLVRRRRVAALAAAASVGDGRGVDRRRGHEGERAGLRLLLWRRMLLDRVVLHLVLVASPLKHLGSARQEIRVGLL